MSIESYIQAIPKVDLHVRLEGAMRKSTLMLIAEQNEIQESLKHFKDWVSLLDAPNYDRLDELIHTVSLWVQVPENLTRLVYDLGTDLAKQNVRYVEVSVNPTLYAENGISFEQLLAAINDGRDRAFRAWNIRMAWVLTLPRAEPRKGDEIARWASGAAGSKGAIVALGLNGAEDVQPAGQFERAFKFVEKKDLPRVVQAGDTLGDQGIDDSLLLNPNRIVGGLANLGQATPEIIGTLVERNIGLGVSMARALQMGKISNYADYPLRHYYDEGLQVALCSEMPSLFKTNLCDQYQAAVEQCGLSIDELTEIAMNAINASFLPASDKATMLVEFAEAYELMRGLHLPETVSK